MVYRRTTTSTRKRPSTSRPTRMYRKKTTTTSRPTSKIARFNYSKKRYYKNRGIANLLSKFSETKYKRVKQINEQQPAAIQAGALAHMTNFVLGGVPTAWGSDYTDIEGITITQGAAESNRVGDYTYLKKTRVSLEIDMKEPTGGVANTTLPCEFRVIVFKSRRQAMPTGTSRAPQQSLFIDEICNDFGHQTAGINGTDLMLQPVNRRHFTIYKDMKFMLSNPLNPTLGAAYSGHYPCMKRIYLDLPHYIKAHYENENFPTNYDYHYGIAVYARSLDKDTKADNWEVNIRGTTTYVDN